MPSRLDPPKPGLPDLPAGFRPGDMPRSSRYQKFAYDQYIQKRSFTKSIVLIAFGLGIIPAWKFHDGGMDDTTAYLIRYASGAALTLGIYFMCCLLKVFDYCGPLPRTILAIAGALAAADLTQHLLNQTVVVYLLGVPWLIAMLVFSGLSADLPELEVTEAGLFGIFAYAGKILLKFVVFDQLTAK
jgi:hypothetical protein